MSNLIEIDYETTTLELKPDDSGPNRATLLSAKSSLENDQIYRAVLYIHGYSDYYFQHHVCKKFLDKGWNFFGLDLHKCGRSLVSPGEYKNRHYCREITEYEEEITWAIDSMIEKSHGKTREIFLFGHSTGGLIATFYANSGPRKNEIKGLILNSPYLGALDTSWAEILMISIVSRLNFSVDIPDNWYGRSIHRSARGEWDFDTEKKTIDKIRLHGAFHSAVQRAQQSIKDGQIRLEIPVLTLCSARSLRAEREWRDEFAEVDLVLNVSSMKENAKLISNQLTINEVQGALHDVFLSRESVREKAFQLTFDWLDRVTNSNKSSGQN